MNDWFWALVALLAICVGAALGVMLGYWIFIQFFCGNYCT